MSKQHALRISPDLGLPADVVTLTTAALGIRGSGKTNTAGVFTEELLKAGHQVIVLDPLNVWWGLKSSADGKSDGFPVVILGGPRGDLPLSTGDELRRHWLTFPHFDEGERGVVRMTATEACA